MLCVQADSATDAAFARIEGVIGHEYFHNWTGNRVTCRDWFQLSLKEGLTVFRDQEFSSDMGSRSVKRIGTFYKYFNACMGNVADVVFCSQATSGTFETRSSRRMPPRWRTPCARLPT